MCCDAQIPSTSTTLHLELVREVHVSRNTNNRLRTSTVHRGLVPVCVFPNTAVVAELAYT
jgi:hypothetical protein